MCPGFRLLPFLLVFPTSTSFGQSNGASFLKIPVGARAHGLGSAFTAISDDTSALFWNPGGLAHFKRKEVGFSHSSLHGGLNYEYMAYIHPTRFVNIGVYASYLSYPSIEGRDSQGRPSSDFTASDRSLALSFGRKFGALGLGASTKLIRQNIADSAGTGFAFDVGASYPVSPKLRLGLVALHMGPPIKRGGESDRLPFSLGAGAGYAIGKQALLAADIKYHVHERTRSMGFGLELEAFRGFFLRAGYLTFKERSPLQGSSPLGRLARLRGGLGLRYSGFLLDYSFTPSGELGHDQRISLGYRF